MAAPLPLHEAERLQVLREYRILDTPPEITFERLTSLAARLFDAPMVHVSFVDADRQWFKACFGTDTRQTDRKLSFCAYTILSDQVMVVPNALKDPRFVNNALVTGPPYIRFYAGAPLKTPEGHNLGSLCIIDTAPRQFDAEQQSRLADMAAMVMDELELRRTARDLRDREALLRQALRENSQLATAITNLTSGVVITNPMLPNNPIVFANAGFSAMTGYAIDDMLGRNCCFLYGPETDPQVIRALDEAIAAQRSFTGVLQYYRKDGTTFLNEVIMNPVFDTEGTLVSFVVLQRDVTEREQSTQLLEQRVQQRTAELAHSQIEILNRLARAAEFRDDDTGQHTLRVARTAALLAQAMHLPAEQITLIQHAAPLHDVGKIAIADHILLKPGTLTADEFAIMKTHAATGAVLLANGQSEAIQVAERIAGTHHERWDGAGYPYRIAGEQIPLEGRILAVADVFDALTHARPYKHAWSIDDAVAEIVRQRGKQFDPHVVDAFLTLPHAELI